MTDDTLLAHLAPRFTDRIEDLAVEALGYILSKSEVAKCALAEMLREGGVDVGRIARVRTQNPVTGENQERERPRPDLTARDETGATRVLIEAKFGAGLTENQPVKYLDGLPEDRPSALLFVAPENRLVNLWDELQERVSKSNCISLGSNIKKEKIWSVSAGENQYLMLTSWKTLLSSMKAHTNANEETSVLCDIQQLQGLCERMDSEAFLPLNPDELGSEFPRRILSLNSLVERAVEKAKKDGFVNRTQRTTTEEYIGRYIWFGQERVWFGVSFYLWAKHRETPVWLTFGWYSDNIEKLRRALEPLRQKEQPGVIDIDEGWPYTGTMNVPIDIKTGVEFDEVLDAVVEQLRCVAELISSETN